MVSIGNSVQLFYGLSTRYSGIVLFVPLLFTFSLWNSFGIDKKEPPMIGLYPLRNGTTQTQSPSDILSYLSDNSATISTTLPNYLLSTPTFTTPPYTFNASVTAVIGGIVPSGLANNTYSPLFGPKTVLENSSALPTILPSPSVVTLTVTGSGQVSTTTKTYPIPSITLGVPSSSGALIWSYKSVLEVGVAVLGLRVILWTVLFSWTYGRTDHLKRLFAFFS